MLKVRIVADIQSRITAEMKRANISAEQARLLLKKDDEERRKWGMFLYDIDLFDSSLYNENEKITGIVYISDLFNSLIDKVTE